MEIHSNPPILYYSMALFEIYYFILQILLVTDPKNPDKYATVRVSRTGYHSVITRAWHAKDSKCKRLLNEALDLVFTKEELANSKGMGLRKEKRPNRCASAKSPNLCRLVKKK